MRATTNGLSGRSCATRTRERSTENKVPAWVSSRHLRRSITEQVGVPVALRAAGIGLLLRLAAQKRPQLGSAAHDHRRHQVVEVGVVAAMGRDG